MDEYIAGILVVTFFVVVLIGWLYVRTHDKLDNIHEDVKGGNKAIHDRMDRQYHDDAYGIERLRTALAELRKDLIEWWRKK